MRSLQSEFYISKTCLPNSGGKLSDRSTVILDMLSQGKFAGEIMEADPNLTADDIKLAATEALILNKNTQTREERVAKIQERYPRAYERWSLEEETRISALFNEGKSMREISSSVQRQPNAVKSRLERLGVIRHVRTTDP